MGTDQEIPVLIPLILSPFVQGHPRIDLPPVKMSKTFRKMLDAGIPLDLCLRPGEGNVLILLTVALDGRGLKA